MFDKYSDKIKLDKYNEHITNLENSFKSVNIKGQYENITLKKYDLFKVKYNISGDWELNNWSGLSIKKELI